MEKVTRRRRIIEEIAANDTLSFMNNFTDYAKTGNKGSISLHT